MPIDCVFDGVKDAITSSFNVEPQPVIYYLDLTLSDQEQRVVCWKVSLDDEEDIVLLAGINCPDASEIHGHVFILKGDSDIFFAKTNEASDMIAAVAEARITWDNYE
jgi:hypothetical protein